MIRLLVAPGGLLRPRLALDADEEIAPGTRFTWQIPRDAAGEWTAEGARCVLVAPDGAEREVPVELFVPERYETWPRYGVGPHWKGDWS